MFVFLSATEFITGEALHSFLGNRDVAVGYTNLIIDGLKTYELMFKVLLYLV